MNIAYIRVSTDKQTLENQRVAITNYAKKNKIKIHKWSAECVSGTKYEEDRDLGNIMKNLKKGDRIIVSEISRISRKMFEIYSIFNKCIKLGVELHSVKEKYMITDDIQSQFMGIAFGMSAEIERNLISMRTKEALSIKKANGVILGRPKGSSKKQDTLKMHREDIMNRINKGDTITAIAKDYSVARGTIYAFLDKKVKPDTSVLQS
jgi:DNA invertase Pin-like site-specific DNA recombinase